VYKAEAILKGLKFKSTYNCLLQRVPVVYIPILARSLNVSLFHKQ